ncbi:MAG: hypothetical protein KDB27_01445, partial [Planctomycetales bacterium]|nr:hypothetical protein [Planctomycetales bacterium]
MRIYSTPESEAAGEMTVLSIVETLIAMGIYVAIWWLTGSLLHLAIAAIAAPLTLLRTEESVELGLKWIRFRADSLWDRLYWLPEIATWFLSIPMIVCICVFAILVRFTATFAILVRHPIYTLQTIPRNWIRIVLCLDVCRAPEVIPGVDATERAPTELSSLFSTYSLVEAVKESIRKNGFIVVLAAPGMCLLLFLGYLPPTAIARFQ